jgi:mono/diheme cytochrome c family protein
MRFGLFSGLALRTLAAAASLWTCATALASDTALTHPVVPGFERFFANSAADRVLGGRLLLGELNCMACHALEHEAEKAAISVKQAPVLDNVGQRVRPEYLRAFLMAPRTVKPGTTMPDLLAGVSASKKEQHVEALVHFLASTGTTRDLAVLEQAVQRGEALFHQVGCVACHQPRRGETRPLATSVPLGDLSQKYTLPALAAFLQDPLHVRPSGRMPNLNLTEIEARDVASFLLRDLEVPGNINFAYYEGAWDKLPDFSQLQPQATGTAPGLDVGVARRRDQFALRFEAVLTVEQPGQHRFFLSSDDGSQLWIDGQLVIDNDGIHATTEKDAKVQLTAGPHAVRVDYFEQGGEETLKVEYQGPGVSLRPLDYALTREAGQTPAMDRGFRVDPALAQQGRQLFSSLGCASCHAMKSEGATVKTELAALTLKQLDAEKGCLAVTPQTAAPHFALSSQQRLFLGAAVEAAKQGPFEPLSGRAAVAHTLTTFNCYACHERDRVGGVESERNAFFATTIQEMGDEGRIPPHLTHVGDKLRPQWMQRVFAQGAKDRPYLLARMPKFGQENLGDLASLLKTLDDQPSDPLPATNQPPRRLKNAGHRLVGDQGLSCIKCHTFGELGSTGIQAISLTTMHRRLNEDWFHRYMLNPAAMRPGTRMPAPWPDGVSLLPGILDGDARQQIHAVWMFLADGPQAAVPRGLTQGAMELVAEDRPIVYRNFIEGAGSSAIAVGFPEKANLAFDPHRLRLALLWQGAFMDASRHWTSRGSGFQPPLGRNVLKLPDGAPLARLASPDESWPDTPAKEPVGVFRGYRLDEKGRPTFLYDCANAHVEDTPVAVETEEDPMIRRTYRIEANSGEGALYLRAATAGSITRDGDWYIIDKDWRMRLVSDRGEPVMRSHNGRQELLLPLESAEGVTTITQEYAW